MKRDLKLSEDGDLMLGQQAVDEEGHLVYYHNVSQMGDVVHMTRESQGGVPVRDVRDVTYENFDLQLIKSRVQTENPDWILYPEIGANLSDLIGELNNQETATQGIASIYKSLTHDGAFEQENVSVDAIPISQEELLFDIQLTNETNILRYAVIFNFDVGIVNAFEIN